MTFNWLIYGYHNSIKHTKIPSTYIIKQTMKSVLDMQPKHFHKTLKVIWQVIVSNYTSTTYALSTTNKQSQAKFTNWASN